MSFPLVPQPSGPALTHSLKHYLDPGEVAWSRAGQALGGLPGASGYSVTVDLLL